MGPIATITWHPGEDKIDANIAATISLDRAAWEATGARFTAANDGDGHTPGLAIATVDDDSRTHWFGVLAYADDEVTHLLVPGHGAQRAAVTSRILRELSSLGIINAQTDQHIVGATKGTDRIQRGGPQPHPPQPIRPSPMITETGRGGGTHGTK